MKNDSARDKAMDKWVEVKLRSGLNPGGPSCLDAEILASYVERTLTSRERDACETHLASCAKCQEHVAALIRLSEADEPAGVQATAVAPARAPGIRWFRWAWAGPTLAALLVIGIYVGGPFRNDIQRIPGPENKIQNPVPNKPATPALGYDEKKSNVPLPPASNSRRMVANPPSENQVLDKEGRKGTPGEKSKGPQSEPVVVGSVEGNLTRRESSGKAQNEVTPQPPPQPASAPPHQPAGANDRIEASPQGAIATPSVRADLAKKDERGQGTGTIGGAVSGGAAGIASRTAPAKSSASQSSDDLQSGGRNAPANSSQPGRQTTNEKTRSMKSGLFDHQAKEKKEAQTNDTDRAGLPENERDKKQSTQSVSVSSATEQAMVASSVTAPVWRVGRHGLIQKLDANGKWKKQKSGVHADLNAIAFPSPDAGWAVGQEGTVLRTTDGGASWSRVPSPTTQDFTQIRATSDQSASLVTRGGQTFNTFDGGATWSTATH